MASASLADRVAGALNDAQLTTDRHRKVELLSRVTELVLQTAPASLPALAASQLLRDAVGAAAGFQTDASSAARKWAVRFLDSAAKVSREHEAALVRTLTFLVQDSAAGVSRSAVAACTGAYRRVWRRLLSTGSDRDGCWAALTDLRGPLLKRATDPGAAPLVQEAAVRYAEAVAVCGFELNGRSVPALASELLESHKAYVASTRH